MAFVIEESGVFVQLFRTVIRGKLKGDTNLDDAARALVPLVITGGSRERLPDELKAAMLGLRTSWQPARGLTSVSSPIDPGWGELQRARAVTSPGSAFPMRDA